MWIAFVVISLLVRSSTSSAIWTLHQTWITRYWPRPRPIDRMWRSQKAKLPSCAQRRTVNWKGDQKIIALRFQVALNGLQLSISAAYDSRPSVRPVACIRKTRQKNHQRNPKRPDQKSDQDVERTSASWTRKSRGGYSTNRFRFWYWRSFKASSHYSTSHNLLCFQISVG